MYKSFLAIKKKEFITYKKGNLKSIKNLKPSKNSSVSN